MQFCKTANWAGSAQCLQDSYGVFNKVSTYSYLLCHVVDSAAKYCETSRSSEPVKCLQDAYDVFNKMDYYDDVVDNTVKFCTTAYWAGSAQCLQGSFDVFNKHYSAQDSAEKAAAACSEQSLSLSGFMLSHMHAFMMMLALSASCLAGITFYIRHSQQTPSISQVPLLG